MNSNFFYDNVLLAVFVGLLILAVALAVNYFRKPTYKNQPDIVLKQSKDEPRILGMYKPMFDHMKLVHGITMNDDSILQVLDVADAIRGYMETKIELRTCQADRDNYKGLWEKSVERMKALKRDSENQQHGREKAEQERDDWKAVSEGLQKEYDSMKQERDECKNAVDSAFKIHDETKSQFRGEIQRLESELDRGNEIITWMKSDLQSLRANRQKMEIACARLMQIAYYRDGARFRKVSDNLESLEWIGELFGCDIRNILDLKRINAQSLFDQRAWRAQMPQPQPVKHLREVNEEHAAAVSYPETVNEAGEDLRKKPRLVSSLKKKEAIQVNNDAESDAILKLMDSEGWKWISGNAFFESKPEREFPYCLHISSKGEGLSKIACDRIGYIEMSKRILPASDFLPAEQPTAEFSGKPFYTDAQLKEIEEVNNSTKPAFQPEPKPLALSIDTGSLQAAAITFDADKIYPIYKDYQREKGAVGTAKIYIEGGYMFASLLELNSNLLSAYNDGMFGLFISASVEDDGIKLIDLSFCVRMTGEAEPIEPRKDHPCLKGCSKPDGCFCRPGTPRDGKVRLRHPREFFVEKGILPEQGLDWKDEEDILRKWAQPQGMEIRCRSGCSPADGIVKYEYAFTRPAVNSDFDECNANF